MRHFLSLFSLLMLLACNHSNSPSVVQKSPEATDFEAYSQKIPVLKLPLKFNCGDQLKGFDFGLDSEAMSRYCAGTIIWGKIAETEQYTAIIYLYAGELMRPLLKTFDKEGKTISQIDLYEEVWCDENEEAKGEAFVEIDNQSGIWIENTILRYKRDMEGDIIPETENKENKKWSLLIKADGRVEKR